MNAGPFAIIGNPVQNSLSPALFRAAYPHAPERTYGRLEVSAAETAWELVQSMGLQGGNVTMPFKAAFARFAAIKDALVVAGATLTVSVTEGTATDVTFSFDTEVIEELDAVENL